MRLTVGSGEKVMDPCENNSMLLTIVVKMGMGYIVVLKELKGILLTQKESHEQSQHLSKVMSLLKLKCSSNCFLATLM